MTRAHATPFFSKTAWYIDVAKNQREYLQPGTPEEKAEYAKQKAAGQRASLPIPSEVWEKVHKLLAIPADEKNIGKTAVSELAARFLADKKSELTPKALEQYEMKCLDFGRFAGRLELKSVTPSIAKAWRTAHPKWKSKSTVRSAYKKIIEMFNWAVTEKLVKVNPLGDGALTLPSEEKREYLVTAHDVATIEKYGSPEFNLFFRVLMLTGRRPGEVACLTADNVIEVAGGIAWLLKSEEHKNGKTTGKSEPVFLNPEAQKLTRLQLEKVSGNRSMTLFHTPTGLAWVGGSDIANDKIDDIKKRGKLSPDLVLYSCRHTYISNALLAGIPIATVALLVGNSVATLLQHYEHVQKLLAEKLGGFAAMAGTMPIAGGTATPVPSVPALPPIPPEVMAAFAAAYAAAAANSNASASV